MNLIDSSGWLSYFADTKNAENFASVIENGNDIYINALKKEHLRLYKASISIIKCFGIMFKIT